MLASRFVVATVGGGFAGNDFSSKVLVLSATPSLNFFFLLQVLSFSGKITSRESEFTKATKRVSLTSECGFVGGASRADGVPLKIINFGLCTRAITLRLLETVELVTL